VNDLLAEIGLDAIPAFASHTSAFPFAVALATDAGDFPAFSALTVDAGHVAFAFAADARDIAFALTSHTSAFPFAVALATDAGDFPAFSALAPDAGYVTLPLAADAGHVAFALTTDAGHVTLPLAPDAGHFAFAFTTDAGHVAPAFAPRRVSSSLAPIPLAPARGGDALKPFLIALVDILQLHHLSGREFADSRQQVLVAGGHDHGGSLGALDLLDHHRQMLARFDPLLDQAEELHPKRSRPSGPLLGRRRQSRPRAHQA